MRKNLRLQATLTALAIALALATTLPGTTAQAKSKVAMNKTKVTVCTGKSYTLKMTGISKKVKWSTSDKNVVSITKKSGKKAEKVTIKGNKKGTATVTAKVKIGKKTKTFKCQVTVKGHKYGKTSYKWNKDYSKCTASKKCSRCGKTLKQTVKASSKTTTKATCTEAGTKKYTAKFTKYSFGTKTKKVSIKVKDHSVDSNKKISYKWNGNYSKCTATFYCKVGGEKCKETVKVKKQTTPATKTANGKTVYTAPFKTKGLKKQTKTIALPKVAYLDKTSVTIRSDRPAMITLKNDAIVSATASDSQTTCRVNGNQVTISTKDRIANVEKVTVTIRTSTGQSVDCEVKVEFTSGEYYFGEVNHCYGTYHAYGKYKGTFAPDGSPDYYMDCNTRADYDVAYNFYNHQVRRDGTECNLNQKAQEIERECGERANYATEYSSKIQEEAKAKGYRAGKIHEYFNSLKAEDPTIQYEEDYYTFWENGFEGCSDKGYTNTQINSIVSNWVKYRNNGEWPSWYYANCYKDWCEWSGHTYLE